MKLTSYLKYILLIVGAFCAAAVFASNNTSNQPLFNKITVLLADTIPAQKQPVPAEKTQPPRGKKPDATPSQKQQPENIKRPDVKEVPKARPMPKPKPVGPKVKPVKIIRPKVGPKI